MDAAAGAGIASGSHPGAFLAACPCPCAHHFIPRQFKAPFEMEGSTTIRGQDANDLITFLHCIALFLGGVFLHSCAQPAPDPAPFKKPLHMTMSSRVITLGLLALVQTASGECDCCPPRCTCKLEASPFNLAYSRFGDIDID